MTTAWKKGPNNGEELVLRKQIEPKIDIIDANVDSALLGIATTNGKIGTPVHGSVAADAAAIEAQGAQIIADLEHATTGLPAIKQAVVDANADIDALSDKVGTPAGASVSADIAAVKAQEDAVKADTAAIILEIGDIDEGSVENALRAIRGDIAGLTNNTTFNLAAPEQLERPKAGDPAVHFPILIVHTDSAGNLIDFTDAVPAPALPTAALANTAGTDRSSYLVLPNGTPSTTFERLSLGRYRLDILIHDNEAIENLVLTVTGQEGGATRIRMADMRVDESFTDHFNTVDRQALVDARDAAEATQTALGTTTTGTVASHVEATEVIAQETEDKVDGVQADVDTANAHLVDMKGTGFSTPEDSLHAIAEGVRTLNASSGTPFVAVKSSAAILEGGFEEIALDEAAGFKSFNAELGTLKIRSLTSTCREFRVRVVTKSGEVADEFVVADFQNCDMGDVDEPGLWRSLDREIFINADTVAAKACYVRIDNIDDTNAGGTIFDVRLNGLVLGAKA